MSDRYTLEHCMCQKNMVVDWPEMIWNSVDNVFYFIKIIVNAFWKQNIKNRDPVLKHAFLVKSPSHSLARPSRQVLHKSFTTNFNSMLSEWITQSVSYMINWCRQVHWFPRTKCFLKKTIFQEKVVRVDWGSGLFFISRITRLQDHQRKTLNNKKMDNFEDEGLENESLEEESSSEDDYSDEDVLPIAHNTRMKPKNDKLLLNF